MNTSGELPSLSLPNHYVRRLDNSGFDDTRHMDNVIRHQPEAYVLANYILKRDQRDLLIDVGCGSGLKVPVDREYRVYGLDSNIRNLSAFSRRHRDAVCLNFDFDNEEIEFEDDLDFSTCVIICADVIEHLVNPLKLLRRLAFFADCGAIIVITTPDRDRLHETGFSGPPNNPSHVQEWTLDELLLLVKDVKLPISFFGHTISDNVGREKNTSIVICDKRIDQLPFSSNLNTGSSRLPPLGIIAAFNDGDIIGQVCEWHLEQGIDLHLIDNWSNDETYSIMLELRRRYGDRVTVERFPEDGPEHEYKWTEILDRKASIASSHPGRWILHIDSDEIRTSPWPDRTLAEALEVVESCGYNRVDFCVVNFYPTKNGFNRKEDPLTFFQHFEFGRHPAHFMQHRTWIQPDREAIDLSSSGGHDAIFENARSFPYRFGLLHYSIRSQDHGRRKIFEDRIKRYSRLERKEKGWHNHYDYIDVNEKFLRLPDLLEEFVFVSFFKEYVVELISDAVYQRGLGSLT